MTRHSWSGWALVAAAVLVPVGGLWLATRTWFPQVLSTHGQGIKLMLDYTLVVTGVIFVIGHLVVAWLLLRALRQRETPSPLPSARAQRLVGIVPAVVMAVVAEGGVMALGLPVWGEYYGDSAPDAMVVEVTGRQFFWAVRYPGPDGIFGRTEAGDVDVENPIGLDKSDAAAGDDVVQLNELRLPAGRPIEIRLRSLDVIHSFFVPELFLKQDLMPGMTIPVRFESTDRGRFELACNQICGLGHYRMRGFVQFDDPAEFERWLAEQTPLVDQF